MILSAGAGAFSTDWALVQPKVAAFTRVCSYDRSGAAWSDLGPKPRTMDQEAFDLHRMLTIAGEHGPYVMVGQSLGGMVARIFAESNPKEVAGIVLVDAYSEDSQLFMNGKLVRVRLDAKERSIPAPRTSISISDQLRPTELQDIEAFMKQMGAPQIDAPYNRLPEFSKTSSSMGPSASQILGSGRRLFGRDIGTDVCRGQIESASPWRYSCRCPYTRFI